MRFLKKNSSNTICGCGCGVVYAYMTRNHIPISWPEKWIDIFNGPIDDFVPLSGMDGTITVDFELKSSDYNRIGFPKKKFNDGVNGGDEIYRTNGIDIV